MLLYNSRSRCRCCCLWPFCFLDLEHYSDPVRPATLHSATNGALFDSRPHSVLDHPKPPRFRVLPRRDSLNPDMLVRVVARTRSQRTDTYSAALLNIGNPSASSSFGPGEPGSYTKISFEHEARWFTVRRARTMSALSVQWPPLDSPPSSSF